MNSYDQVVVSRIRSLGQHDSGMDREELIRFDALSPFMQGELLQMAVRLQRSLRVHGIFRTLDEILDDVLENLGVGSVDDIA
jgi:hypothetical protein